MSDPNKKCDRASRALQECLLEEAERLVQNQEYDNALTTFYRTYALRPGATSLLHSIASVYDALGDPESATACRRGVIPEKAEYTYFNAASNNGRFVSSRRASNSQHRKTHRPEKVALPSPQSNGQPNARPEFRATHTESRGSFVSTLTQGSVWFDGYNTVVMDCKDNIVKEHVKGNAHLVTDTARLRPKRRLTGRVCFLDARSASIYYHWMIDVLPKIALLEEAGIPLNSIDHFMVRCDSAFQRQTLEHLGIPIEKVVSPWNDGLTTCQTLIVPFLKHDRGDRFYNGLGLGMARWVPQWLTTRFVNSSTPSSVKLYISRSNRGTRTPIDEHQLVAALESRSFQCVTLESMTVVEQANLLSNASVVVAPHGAGLTNIAFCKPGTQIFELFGSYVVPCYWSLATLARHDYHAYFVDEPSTGTANRTSPVKKQSLSKNSNRPTDPAINTPVDLAQRRNQMIDLNVDDFISYLDRCTTANVIAS